MLSSTKNFYGYSLMFEDGREYPFKPELEVHSAPPYVFSEDHYLDQHIFYLLSYPIRYRDDALYYTACLMFIDSIPSKSDIRRIIEEIDIERQTKNYYVEEKTMDNNNIQTFNFENSHAIQTILDEKGEIWFIAKDICSILGLTDVTKSIQRLDEDEKLTRKLFVSGQNRDVNIINESGLYSLVLTSTKPNAKKFKKWITSEVIPSIRKTGTYSVKELTKLEILEMAIASEKELIEEKKKVKQLETTIEKAQPKIEAYNQFLNTDGLVTMSVLAKTLCDKEFNIGRTRLFRFLKEKGILMNNTEPYQKYVDAGYFIVKQKVIEHNHPENNHLILQTFVTPKGEAYIRSILNRELKGAVR